MIYWGLGISVLAMAGVWFAPRIGWQKFLDVKAEPDLPCAFGYKMSWVAVQTRDTARLIAALGLEETRSVNWSVGIGTVYSDRIGLKNVFVTPPIDGWSLIVGLSLPHPMGNGFEDRCAPLLIDLSREFGKVQYYVSVPELEYYGWVSLRDGRLNRGFACSPEGVIWNRGPVTGDERSIGLDLFDMRVVDEALGECYAPAVREEHVIELARRWSLDPTRLDTREDLDVGIGYLALAPTTWQPAAAVDRRAA